eukprot:snap_masked-scaffold_7-processed-gene-5.37-mRNA-1 protein AED:1.00 eAED:1.00 QI:0/0/0/0/1/1/4/0/73
MQNKGFKAKSLGYSVTGLNPCSTSRRLQGIRLIKNIYPMNKELIIIIKFAPSHSLRLENDITINSNTVLDGLG